MILSELLKYVNPSCIIGDDHIDITGVNIDSRKIEKGHLFVAIKGTQTDGHQFIPKALELGAAAILCEDLPEERKEGVTYVQVAPSLLSSGKSSQRMAEAPSSNAFGMN